MYDDVSVEIYRLMTSVSVTGTVGVGTERRKYRTMYTWVSTEKNANRTLVYLNVIPFDNSENTNK